MNLGLRTVSIANLLVIMYLEVIPTANSTGAMGYPGPYRIPPMSPVTLNLPLFNTLKCLSPTSEYPLNRSTPVYLKLFSANMIEYNLVVYDTYVILLL